jgi:ABC-type transporter Mla subunit MlaD
MDIKDLEITILVLGAVMTGIQIIVAIPFWKYLFKVRDTVQLVDVINADHAKFKVETRTKIKELVVAVDKDLKEITKKMDEVEEDLRKESKGFTAVLHKVDVTLERLSISVDSLNKGMASQEAAFSKTVDRLHEEFAAHRTDIRDQLKDLKGQME